MGIAVREVSIQLQKNARKLRKFAERLEKIAGKLRCCNHHINLQHTLDTAFAAGDAVQIRTAYTNMGLSHHARKWYDRAVECFEEQVLFITDKPEGEACNDAELEALCFAYGLLSQLYGGLVQTEQATASNRRCKEVQIDACLQGLDESLGPTGPEGGHQGKGNVPSFTSL